MNIKINQETQAILDCAGKGPYDDLYLSTKYNILWGNKPSHLLGKLIDMRISGEVLEVGCGDGVNSLYLERKGFFVNGIDISSVALTGLNNRFNKYGMSPMGNYMLMNLNYPVKFYRKFDVIISCGLYHCLDKNSRKETHKKILHKVKDDGVILFSSLVSDIPLPDDHLTEGFVLPEVSEVREMFTDLEIIYYREGIINDRHKPLVDEHKHAVVWVMAKK